MKTFKQIREDKFQLVDMDADTARVAVQLAKKAGLQPKSFKSRSGGLDISVEGPKKKVAKFILSLPESTQLDEIRYTNVYNRIKGVRGLKRKELDMISAIDPDVLAKVVKSLDFLKDEVEEK